MDNLNNIPSTGSFGDVADKLNDNFNKVNIAVETINNKYVRNKGYFPTLAALQTAYPSPKNGDIAYVANAASSSGYYIANVAGGAWVETTTVAPAMSINANEYAKHGYSATPKTLKQVDDSKAESGGSTKTLKQVDDSLVQLESDVTRIKVFPSGALSTYPILNRIKYMSIKYNPNIVDKITISYFGRSGDTLRVIFNINDYIPTPGGTLRADIVINISAIDSSIDYKNTTFSYQGVFGDIELVADMTGGLESNLNLQTASTGMSPLPHILKPMVLSIDGLISITGFNTIDFVHQYSGFSGTTRRWLTKRSDLNIYQHAYYDSGRWVVVNVPDNTIVYNTSQQLYYKIKDNVLLPHRIDKSNIFTDEDLANYPILGSIKDVHIEVNKLIASKITLTYLHLNYDAGKKVRAIFNVDDSKDGSTLTPNLVIDVNKSDFIDLSSVVLEGGIGAGYVKMVVNAITLFDNLNVQLLEEGISFNSDYVTYVPEVKLSHIVYNALVTNLQNARGYELYLDKSKKILCKRIDLGGQWQFAYHNAGKWIICNLDDGTELYNEVLKRYEQLIDGQIIARQAGNNGDTGDTVYDTLNQMYADTTNEFFRIGNQRFTRIDDGNDIRSFQRQFYHRTLLNTKAEIVQDISPVGLIIIAIDGSGDYIGFSGKTLYKSNQVFPNKGSWNEVADLSIITGAIRFVYVLNNDSYLIIEESLEPNLGGVWILKEGVLSKTYTYKNEYVSTVPNWGVEIIDNVILISEYGNSPAESGIGTKANATCIYMSEDYGMTWETIFDRNLHPDFPSDQTMHIHGIHYDPFWRRLWATSGDGIGIKPSNKKLMWTDDFKNPAPDYSNWVTLDLGNYTGNGTDPYNSWQGLSMYATEDFLLIGGDDFQNCLYRVAKNKKNSIPVLEQVYFYKPGSTNEITHYTGRIKRTNDGLILIPLRQGDHPYNTKLLATFDGIEFFELFETEEGNYGGASNNATILIKDNGNIGYAITDNSTGTQVHRYIEFAKIHMQ